MILYHTTPNQLSTFFYNIFLQQTHEEPLAPSPHNINHRAYTQFLNGGFIMQYDWSDSYACMPDETMGWWEFPGFTFPNFGCWPNGCWPSMPPNCCVPCCTGPCKGGPSRSQRPIWRRRPSPYYGAYNSGTNFFLGDFRDFNEIENISQSNA